MVTKTSEVWSNVVQNAEIAASASVVYGNETTDKQNRDKYGSMNTLVLANRSAYPVQIKLDQRIYTEIFGNTTVIIGVDDGVYFDMIEVTNLDAGNAIPAASVTIRYGRSAII